MYVVVKTGGKQYRVSKGDVIKVEKLETEEGKSVTLDEVLLISNEAGTTVGTPFIEGASVECVVVENGKSKKVITFKYKAKKNYRKKMGHRQPFTMLEIKDFITGGKKAETKKSEPKAEVKSNAKSEESKSDSSIKSMKKAELIDFAKSNGIEIDEKATNAVLIATIEAAIK